jgi:hypothetical protein
MRAKEPNAINGSCLAWPRGCRCDAPPARRRATRAHPAVSQAAKDALAAQFAKLDPVMLLHGIRHAQARLAALADATPFAEADTDPKNNVEQFLEGLRHAWKEGEPRPTSRRKPPAPRGRRRPDPLAAVTNELRAWFDEDQSQTGRELLTRLQNLHPDVYPDGLLRTVQRRLRIWRAEVARQLVFGPDDRAPELMAPDAQRDLKASRVRGHHRTAFITSRKSVVRGRPIRFAAGMKGATSAHSRSLRSLA